MVPAGSHSGKAARPARRRNAPDEETGPGGPGTAAILTDPKADALDPTSLADPLRWTSKGAAGWGGDRWQLYRRGADTVTVFASLWDSERDAREFRAVLPRSLRRTAVRQHDGVVVAGKAGDRARAMAREALGGIRTWSR